MIKFLAVSHLHARWCCAKWWAIDHVVCVRKWRTRTSAFNSICGTTFYQCCQKSCRSVPRKLSQAQTLAQGSRQFQGPSTGVVMSTCTLPLITRGRGSCGRLVGSDCRDPQSLEENVKRMKLPKLTDGCKSTLLHCCMDFFTLLQLNRDAGCPTLSLDFHSFHRQASKYLEKRIVLYNLELLWSFLLWCRHFSEFVLRLSVRFLLMWENEEKHKGRHCLALHEQHWGDLQRDGPRGAPSVQRFSRSAVTRDLRASWRESRPPLPASSAALSLAFEGTTKMTFKEIQFNKPV